MRGSLPSARLTRLALAALSILAIGRAALGQSNAPLGDRLRIKVTVTGATAPTYAYSARAYVTW